MSPSISLTPVTSATFLNWFSQNHFKANASKCHFLLSPYEKKTISIETSNIESSNCETLLGIKIDSNLNFEEHVSTLCRKANQKLHALARISKYIGPPKRRIICTSTHYVCR